MLYANFNSNGDISLVKKSEVENLATYDELIEEASCGCLEFVDVMGVKDGVIFWDENETEMSFMEFN